MGDVMNYLRTFAGPDGDCHFEDLQTELAPAEFIPGLPTMGLSPTRPSTAVVFARLPAGWDGVPHPSPRRQFVFTLAGEAEVTSTDGNMRRMKPGTVWLVEDTTGKGHRTRVTDAGGWLIALVWLD